MCSLCHFSVSINLAFNDYTIQVSNERELVLLGTGLKSHQKVHSSWSIYYYTSQFLLQFQLEETAKQLGARTVESFTSQGYLIHV
jgi:hypothetical protein